MKTYLVLFLTGVSVASLPCSSNASIVGSFLFDVDAASDQGTEVGATGGLSFHDDGKVDVTIFNDSANLATITKFYFLKPKNLNGDRMDLDSFLNSPTTDRYAVDGMDVSVAAGTGASVDLDDYFGAEVAPPTGNGLGKSQSGFFSFQLDPLGSQTDILSYLEEDETPFVFVRWQEVGLNGQQSAKDWAFYELDGPVNPVPEPRRIALAGMAVLGGLVYLRRRYKKRAVPAVEG